MSAGDFRREIEGYAETMREIEVLRKYGRDYRLDRGRVAQIVGRLHPKRVPLRVSEILSLTAGAKSFKLVSAQGYLPPFQAGQYINLFVNVGGVMTSRPYSIASGPNQTGFYEIAVRRVPDGFVSNYLLDEVEVGDEFTSTAPSGNFYHNPLFHGADLVLLAGGSGITPFMSMIREKTDRGLGRRIHLIYGSDKPDDILFKDELDDRAARHDDFEVSHVISSPPPGYGGLTGFITADLITDLVGEVLAKTFYVCGPEAMYAFCLAELDKLGLPRRRIRTEVFGAPKEVTAQPGWPDEVKADDRFEVGIRGGGTIPAAAGEPLMIAFERAGMTVETSCRSGECSLCRTKLLSGLVFQPPGVKLRKSDRRFGYIHPCLAYPVSDLEVLI